MWVGISRTSQSSVGMSWCGLVSPLVLVALVTGGGAQQLGCRDQNGTIVDWYVLFKLPTSRHYVYVSSQSAEASWTLSDVSINDALSEPGQTLQPIYDDPQRDSLVYVFYNDAMPNGTTTGVKGHTKGVVAFDAGGSGFWMVHSVPRFPPPPSEGYGFPETGQRFGQSFLCMTLSSDQMESVAQQLLYMEPFIYASQMSSSLRAQFPEMARVIAGERHSGVVPFQASPLATPCGSNFLSIAKSRHFRKDLYSQLVAPILDTSLNAETWIRAARPEARLPTSCEGNFCVHNVLFVDITIMAPVESGWLTISIFNNSRDHSKWAVSRNRNNPWVCIGDINRTTTQFRRGGGIVCYRNDFLWQIFSRMVARVEENRNIGNACSAEACMPRMSTTTQPTTTGYGWRILPLIPSSFKSELRR